VDDRAARFHGSLVLIDGHCDTAMAAIGIGLDDASMEPLDIRVRHESGHVDIPRLLEGGVTAQFFALFTNDANVGQARETTYRMLGALEDAFAHDTHARLALRARDVTEAKRAGRLAAFLAIEGGEAIGDSLDDLRGFHARGVRLMTLTWNRINAIGRGAAHPGPDGLTPFGLKVIAEMENLGMIVDASHLCDQALSELLAVARRPVVASHSNSRALVDHRRNLTDAQAEGIAATGGLVAVTFAGAFVDADPAKVSVARVVDHVDHLVSVVGAAHVGLGTDFDGFGPKSGTVMPDCTHLPELTAELSARGYDEADIRAIMGGNWLRVIQDVAG
jgi:membrane dipeptidase